MLKIAKILNDKYYTSPDLAEYCVKKTEEIIGKENITEYLEPSAGSGVFLDYLPSDTLAYDIQPEDDRIIKQDYLNLNLEYKKGRCVIGNPPFGDRCNLYRKFYNKSCKIADYIAFILPISQFNNNVQLYDFDLIYSEDLGEKEYSNIKLHCCFNIYRRPKNKELNKKPNFKLYEEAWKELKDKLLKANKELAIMSLNSKVKESYRLSGKLEGITLVYGYMQDIESSIE